MKKAFLVLILFLFLISLVGCSNIRSKEAAEGSRMGALADSTSVKYAALHGTMKEYDTFSELTAALKSGSVDCIIVDERNVKDVKKAAAGVKKLSEPLADSNFRIAVAIENPDLVKDINASLKSFSDNGILDDIINGHYKTLEYCYECESAGVDAKALTVAVCGDFAPFAYFDEDGHPAGIDVDIARAICAKLGLQCNIRVVDSSELIKEVKNGTAHFALGGITQNSDSAEECLMSNVYASCTQVIMTR